MTKAHPVTAQRIRGLPLTIFGEMSALAARTGSINLGQGAPTSSGPAAMLAVAATAITEGRNQYAPGIGLANLREAIAEHQREHYGLQLDPDTQVCVTTGATEGIAAAIMGLVDAGDEVVVFEPFYDSYPAMVSMCGARLVPVRLAAPDFALDAEALRAAITTRTKLIMLNSPHNPTGKVFTRYELTAIAELAVTHDLIVVTDEVYEHLTFDGVKHVPIATLPGMAERTLTLSSAGKSYSVTGWKVGWATGPRELVSAVYAAKQWLTYTSGTPLQHAVAWALREAKEFPGQLADELAARRDVLTQGLESAGLAPSRAQGTYFVMTDVAPLGWSHAMDFCLALPERAGLVAIPAHVFYARDAAGASTWVRWAFCKDATDVRAAVERLSAARLTA